MNGVLLLRAEWSKLRSLAGTWWSLLGLAATTVGVGAAFAAGDPHQGDPVKLALSGVVIGQLVAAVFGALAMGAEYSTGTIAVTVAAMPRRGPLLAAKAAVVAGATAVAGAVGVVGSLAVGRVLLPHLPVMGTAVLRASVGTVLYLVLIALLGMGLATALRDATGALSVVLGLLLVLPLIGDLLRTGAWHNRIEKYAPMPAGRAIQATRGLAHLEIGPWPGLGVLALYALGALVAGLAVLHLRDV